MIFLQAIPAAPEIIQSQTDIVQLIYLFGSIIVVGLMAALYYLRTELKAVQEQKDVTIEKKDLEIKELSRLLTDSDKANLIVLKDLLTIQAQHGDNLKNVENLIYNQTNPKVIETYNEVLRISKNIENERNI